MPKALTDNLAGHRSKYDLLAAHLPASEVGKTYVGGGDPVYAGYVELELIRAYTRLEGLSIVDIGCGIGRLTQHLLSEPISYYLGIDVISEVLDQALSIGHSDPRFNFELAQDCRIPREAGSVTAVVAFSVLTHLIDEEVFEYFTEAHRVLRPGGTAIYTFLDFNSPGHQEMFFNHARQHRHGHGDMLKFTTQGVLALFADRAGFKSVRFVDGQDKMPFSGYSSALIDVATLGPTFQMGQSACILQA